MLTTPWTIFLLIALRPQGLLLGGASWVWVMRVISRTEVSWNEILILETMMKLEGLFITMERILVRILLKDCLA